MVSGEDIYLVPI